MRKIRTYVLAATAVCALAGAAFAYDAAPSATITLSGGAVAAGVGFTWGNGDLNFQGRTYPFHVDGLSFVDVGIASITGAGDVYNLNNLADFDGNYVSAGMGATIAGGGTVAVLENEHGVIIHFHSTTAGLRLNLNASGVRFTLTH